MISEVVNEFIKINKEEIMEYLDVLTNELLCKYKSDPEKICEKLGFNLVSFYIEELRLTSYLRNEDGELSIGIDEKLDEYNRIFHITKQLIAYFIIRYYIDRYNIREEVYKEDSLYYFSPEYEDTNEMGKITNYYSASFLSNYYYDKKSIKKNKKDIKKYKKRVLRKGDLL